MSLNSSSSSSNDSPLDPTLSYINAYLPFDIICIIYRPGSLIFITFAITNILLFLPLSILILYLGLQRWCQQRSSSTTAATSHSDIFTYHMVIMELLGVLGCILSCCGIYWVHVIVMSVGFCLFSLSWYGEMFFHILTSVERYLAVVHPITYLSLKRERGIRIRNITIGCVWLLCFGGMGLMTLKHITAKMDFCLLFVSLIVISFCSLSVLCVLIRPGPGEQGGDRERVDQSKKRAFYTIMVILGVLLLRCSWSLVLSVLMVKRETNDCAVMMCEVWFNFPSSLVLPLLFLYRAGTLACSRNNTRG